MKRPDLECAKDLAFPFSLLLGKTVEEIIDGWKLLNLIDTSEEKTCGNCKWKERCDGKGFYPSCYQPQKVKEEI